MGGQTETEAGPHHHESRAAPGAEPHRDGGAGSNLWCTTKRPSGMSQLRIVRSQSITPALRSLLNVCGRAMSCNVRHPGHRNQSIETIPLSTHARAYLDQARGGARAASKERLGQSIEVLGAVLMRKEPEAE